MKKLSLGMIAWACLLAYALNLSAQTTKVNDSGVVNAAGFASGPVSPGSIVSIFGTNLATGTGAASSLPLPATINGTSVVINGSPAPLFFVSPTQINAQVPAELEGQIQGSLTVTVNGQTSPAQTVRLAPFGPGVFATNQQGTGQGAILDASGILLDPSHPAIPGSTVLQIYCTGLGAVTNQPPSGTPAPSTPLAATVTTPTVTIGGAPATVLFSGLAPGFVGLYQINAQMPAAVTQGNAEPAWGRLGLW